MDGDGAAPGPSSTQTGGGTAMPLMAHGVTSLGMPGIAMRWGQNARESPNAKANRGPYALNLSSMGLHPDCYT
jgi:hypothetical protein